MKNTTKLFGIASVLILAACGPAKVEETQTTPPANETTIIHTEAPKPAEPQPEPDTKSTEVTINKDGSKIETKNGTSGTKVEISKGEAEIIIKK